MSSSFFNIPKLSLEKHLTTINWDLAPKKWKIRINRLHGYIKFNHQTRACRVSNYQRYGHLTDQWLYYILTAVTGVSYTQVPWGSLPSIAALNMGLWICSSQNMCFCNFNHDKTERWSRNHCLLMIKGGYTPCFLLDSYGLGSRDQGQIPLSFAPCSHTCVCLFEKITGYYLNASIDSVVINCVIRINPTSPTMWHHQHPACKKICQFESQISMFLLGAVMAVIGSTWSADIWTPRCVLQRCEQQAPACKMSNPVAAKN